MTENAPRVPALQMTDMVHFKGEWVQQFPSVNTKNRAFYIDDDFNQLMPTMAVEGIFLHGESSKIQATFVQLPFKVNALFI